MYLEVLGRPLGLAVLPEVGVRLPPPEPLLHARERGEPAGVDEEEPPTEEGGLGEAGGEAALLRKRRNGNVI